MTRKTATRRAWCPTCRAFTDHRNVSTDADSTARLECATCQEKASAAP